MQDLAFYNAGCLELRGIQRLIVPFRRLLRRVLRPVFFRQVEIFRQLYSDLDSLKQGLDQCKTGLASCLACHAALLDQQRQEISHYQEQLQELRKKLDHQAKCQERLEALHWDQVAVARRLAILEDRTLDLSRNAE